MNNLQERKIYQIVFMYYKTFFVKGKDSLNRLAYNKKKMFLHIEKQTYFIMYAPETKYSYFYAES